MASLYSIHFVAFTLGFVLILLDAGVASPVPSSRDKNPSSVCDNINNCRQLSDILWGCFATIFACVYVAVHRNIPRVSNPDDPNRWQDKWIAWTVSQIESLTITMVAIFLPEWILAWAAGQWLTAHKIARELESLAAKARLEKDEAETLSMEHQENAWSSGGYNHRRAQAPLYFVELYMNTNQ